MSKDAIYMDYAATTPMDNRVLEAMLPFFTQQFGNASSKHSYGREASNAVENAENVISTLLNANQVIFTSGATEAINLAIKGVCEANFDKGNHIITVSTEHKAVLDTCNYLEGIGAEITYLSVNNEGFINLEELENSIRADSVLVCVMYANNETGIIQPIDKIGEICKKKNVLFMTDATQAVGKVPIDMEAQNIDLLCFSGHKIYGPKGIGTLCMNDKTKLNSQIHGGNHQKGHRAGTLDVPSIVGMGKACEIANSEMNTEAKRMQDLGLYFKTKLREFSNVKINSSSENSLPNIINVQFQNQDAEVLMEKMGELAISSGSACTSALVQPSHVLKSMGLSDESANSSLRFSIGRFMTKNEVDVAMTILSRFCS
ncbi:MAG: cysteine desulfurase [Arenicella sp.]|jgi:cysteine desulfurase